MATTESAEAAKQLGDIASKNFHSGNLQAQMEMERKMAKEYVMSEFNPTDPNDPIARAMHSGSPAVEHVYGGRMSSGPHELQLVQAWRPSEDGTWQLGRGVIHRVHHEDETVTVQFVPDQHRCRLPVSCVKPQLDITPVYPKVRLAPGERIPTAAEIAIREHNANILRQQLGIAPDAPLPGAKDEHALKPGEHLGDQGQPVIESNEWGIPATTLTALRNRAIPFSQVTGIYGQHFYTNLYKNNFYPQKGVSVSQTGHVGIAAEMQPRGHREPKVVTHKYIPLRGPEMMQNLKTGAWRLANEQDSGAGIEGPGLLG